MEHKEARILRELLQDVVWRRPDADRNEVGWAANDLLSTFDCGEWEAEFRCEANDGGARVNEHLEIWHYATVEGSGRMRMRCSQVRVCWAVRPWMRNGEMLEALASPTE